MAVFAYGGDPTLKPTDFYNSPGYTPFWRLGPTNPAAFTKGVNIINPDGFERIQKARIIRGDVKEYGQVRAENEIVRKWRIARIRGKPFTTDMDQGFMQWGDRTITFGSAFAGRVTPSLLTSNIRHVMSWLTEQTLGNPVDDDNTTPPRISTPVRRQGRSVDDTYQRADLRSGQVRGNMTYYSNGSDDIPRDYYLNGDAVDMPRGIVPGRNLVDPRSRVVTFTQVGPNVNRYLNPRKANVNY